MYDVVIKHGTVVSSTGTVHADVAIDGERIAAVGVGLQGVNVIDAADCFVIPGGVDPHVHLQMTLSGRTSTDTFETGTIAAVCGGTTTVIDFVTPETGQSLVAALKYRQREAEGNVASDYGLHMTIPAWHAADVYRMADVSEVVEKGCATVKMYQAYDGMALDDVALLRAMRVVADANGGVVLHSEVGPVIESLRRTALHEGHTGPIWHAHTRPARLEASAVHRAIALAELAGVRLYIFHVGAREVVDAIRQARHEGLELFAETCPHYLLLTAENHLSGPDGSLSICAPPLRSAADQTVLWEALQDGTLNVVSTDHCPWTRREKAQADFTAIPGGVPGIESRLSLIHHFGVGAGALSLERWVDVCCTQPARLMGLQNKGLISPGYDADIVIFDPALHRRIGVEALHEAADWTPYEGVELIGWPRTVLLRGQVVVSESEHLGLMQGVFTERTLSAM